jgi:DNA-binding Lrp family transcriptional regulator
VIFAFLLVNTELGNESKVMDFLRTIHEVKEVYSMMGVYDIIAKIKTEDMTELRQIFDKRLRRFKGIKSITLMMIIPEKIKSSLPAKQTIEILA